MKFRKVSIDDAHELAALLKNIGWFEFLAKRSDAEGREHVKAQLQRCLADDSHFIYVAESDQKIIGYVSAHWLPYLFLRGSEGYISELFVRDSARGQGVGRDLLARIEAEAKARGCHRLSLINFRGRESYQRLFYVKAGWQERAEASNFLRVLD